MEAGEAAVGAVYVTFVYVSIFYFWNWVLDLVAGFVSGFGFPFQCPTLPMFAFLMNLDPDVFLVAIHSLSIQSIRLVSFRYFFFPFLVFFAPNPNLESLPNAGHLTDTSLPRPDARRELALEQDHTQRQGYYPLWQVMSFIPSFSSYFTFIRPSPQQLVYQSTVFMSRSSISVGLPALPRRWIKVLRLCRRRFWQCWRWRPEWVCLGGGGGGDAMWKAIVGKAKRVVDGDGEGARIWKEGVRNVWCVFALV